MACRTHSSYRTTGWCAQRVSICARFTEILRARSGCAITAVMSRFRATNERYEYLQRIKNASVYSKRIESRLISHRIWHGSTTGCWKYAERFAAGILIQASWRLQQTGVASRQRPRQRGYLQLLTRRGVSCQPPASVAFAPLLSCRSQRRRSKSGRRTFFGRRGHPSRRYLRRCLHTRRGDWKAAWLCLYPPFDYLDVIAGQGTIGAGTK